ncbi:hypothetical protein [Psychromicrobium xiongbiense]|uniref:hypothetical protein n=1 Tax=Psychromicrobium xiongbiense TaxID=3051184 RepID=UPI0025530D30|nr:hypothetical protein [Psychromicrobium sp. YIM S02556]
MTQYIIYFNQQWVGDHSEEWFASRGPLARAVVEELKNDGVYVFAGGLEEDINKAFSANARNGTLEIAEGSDDPFRPAGTEHHCGQNSLRRCFAPPRILFLIKRRPLSPSGPVCARINVLHLHEIMKIHTSSRTRLPPPDR